MDVMLNPLRLERKRKYRNIKGLVFPKMKIKSLITHPHAVSTP